jgi:hypothetical protein
MINPLTTIGKIHKLYLIFSTFISAALSYHTSLKTALLAFAIITLLDTLTRINAAAKKEGLKFNPFKGYFYRQIKSKGLRDMCDKIFARYGVYLMIAFVVDCWILDRMVLMNFNDKGLTLPIISLYVFCAIEIWSIGENIEDAGGINIIKRILHLLPEKIQKLFYPDGMFDNDNKKR